MRHRQFIWFTILLVGFSSNALPTLAQGAQNRSTSGPSSGGAGSTPVYQAGPSSSTSTATSQNAYSGSVPAGKASPEVLPLSLQEAVDRGLKQNLGLLLTSQGVVSARGQKWQQLSNLLPNLTARASENLSQVDLAALGIKINFPGVPKVVGPFGYFDVRAYATQTLLDFRALDNTRAASQSVRAAEYSYKDARDLVALAVGYAYLQAIAGAARIDTAEAQQKTAQALYDQAADQQKAGISPAIDTLRAKVELQTREQQLIAARNDFAKQKLVLARIIGLPLGQEFTLTDKAPYEPLAPATPDEAVRRAYASRSDYQSALAQVRSAEYARKAATAGYLPSLSVSADYGDIGVNPANSHGTVDASVSLRIPIFEGGKVHGEVLQAEAALAQTREQLDNLRGQIDQDVRNALFDLQSASDQVAVAQSNVGLADETLVQAKDRFAAGVTNNIEVIQAQEAVAGASEAYISSLYAYNSAKIALARAVGFAEEGVKQYLKRK